jgi:hypothetical protein
MVLLLAVRHSCLTYSFFLLFYPLTSFTGNTFHQQSPFLHIAGE